MAHYTVPLPRLEPDVRAHVGLREVAPYVGLDLAEVSFAGDDTGLEAPLRRETVDVEVKIEKTENSECMRLSASPVAYS